MKMHRRLSHISAPEKNRGEVNFLRGRVFLEVREGIFLALLKSQLRKKCYTFSAPFLHRKVGSFFALP